MSESADDRPLPPALRRYLYGTAAVTGAAILIVEILGAKMLSPYVGTSHFVWTAQITVTLVSLALGYWFGGWLADRSPRLGRLYACIAVAAAWLCLSVRICEPTAYWGLRYSIASAALLASGVLFFVPLTLLAVTGPFLVRVLTRSVDVVGGRVGTISAVGTLGSVGGTVLIGYVLVPYLPNSITMYLTAAVLVALVLGYVAVFGRVARPALVAAVAGLLIGWAGVVRDGRVDVAVGERVFRGNSNFGDLQVVKIGSRYSLLNDLLEQNVYDVARRQSADTFVYALHGLARAYTARIDDALCIGLGVGSVPMLLAREGVRVDVVEINPAIIDVAVRFFDLDPARMAITLGDGRQFLNAAMRTYDTVVLDAFLGESSPSHLMTREAFAAMRRVLRPGGTLVINTFGSFRAGRDFLTASLDRTLRAVFASVRIHTDGDNAFFVASDRAELAYVHPPAWSDAHPSCQRGLAVVFGGVQTIDDGHGIVLTDDYNPVEFRDAANRVRLRRRLAFALHEEG